MRPPVRAGKLGPRASSRLDAKNGVKSRRRSDLIEKKGPRRAKKVTQTVATKQMVQGLASGSAKIDQRKVKGKQKAAGKNPKNISQKISEATKEGSKKGQEQTTGSKSLADCPTRTKKESRKVDTNMTVPQGSNDASEEGVKSKRGRPRKLETANQSTSAQKGALKKAPPAKRKYFDRLEFDGTLFEVGDYVYIKKSDDAGAESDEELEECRICGNCPSEGENMLECDTCLGGFHMGCLDPPLMEVPEGDWYCPKCAGAECGNWVQRERQRRRTARERFLAGELYMARINMIWQDPNGEYSFRGNWLDLPEDTHMGRQAHNHRREVLLSTLEDDIFVDCIIRHAWVYSRERFEQSTNEGDDVYLLEYGYCPRTQRYKRIDEIADDGRGWNYELSDDDGDFQPSKEDDGASEDEDFSADEEDDEGKKGRKRRKSAGTKQKRKEKTEPTSRTQSARKQRQEALAQLGAKEIPAAARKRTLSKLEAAQAALTLAALPKKLSCRDKERQQVTAFVEEAVSAGSECLGSCLYISGVPGTGKTATVLEVMRGLRRRVETKELLPFQFVEINALRVPSPAHVYSALHEALTGEYLGPKNALEHLQQRFSTEPRGKAGLAQRPLVVLVDELDLLVTRNQSVLYNIFDWPTLPHSRLIVIGIANTIDLPERMLPRIASRMGLRRVAFNPYTREQLQEIVADRLAGIPAFQPEAIELASRKVASASGDVRRALELCRRAAELAAVRQKEALTSSNDVTSPAAPKEPNAASGSGFGSGSDGAGPSSAGGLGEGSEKAGDVLVELRDVDAAVKEMFDSPHIKSIERFSRHEQILLMALVMVMRRTGVAETNFESVASAHIDMCRAHGELPPSHANLGEMVSRLGSSHVVICEPGHRHRLRKIELNVPSDDVTFALKRCGQVSWLKKLAEQRG